jgi:hypothetical protein
MDGASMIDEMWLLPKASTSTVGNKEKHGYFSQMPHPTALNHNISYAVQPYPMSGSLKH